MSNFPCGSFDLSGAHKWACLNHQLWIGPFLFLLCLDYLCLDCLCLDSFCLNILCLDCFCLDCYPTYADMVSNVQIAYRGATLALLACKQPDTVFSSLNQMMLTEKMMCGLQDWPCNSYSDHFKCVGFLWLELLLWVLWVSKKNKEDLKKIKKNRRNRKQKINVKWEIEWVQVSQ